MSLDMSSPSQESRTQNERRLLESEMQTERNQDGYDDARDHVPPGTCVEATFTKELALAWKDLVVWHQNNPIFW